MRLRFLAPMGGDLWGFWSDFCKHWFTSNYESSLMEELVVIFPQLNLVENSHGLSTSSDSQWSKISLAWYQIQSALPGTRLQAWRVIYEYGDEIAPGLGVFRLRDSNHPCLFWPSPEQDYVETQARLADLLPKISAHWHITQGRGLFHAAGILHNEKAYLFIGTSGAGKSTISALSKEQGDKIIHDDHVVVYRGETGKWLVSDTSHSVQGTPIKAILFIVQDQEDQLLPINTARTAKGLIKSLHEHGKHVLFGDVFRSAFSTCAEIARQVPGNELYFRKSPDFWKLIDGQFPD